MSCSTKPQCQLLLPLVPVQARPSLSLGPRTLSVSPPIQLPAGPNGETVAQTLGKSRWGERNCLWPKHPHPQPTLAWPPRKVTAKSILVPELHQASGQLGFASVAGHSPGRCPSLLAGIPLRTSLPAAPARTAGPWLSLRVAERGTVQRTGEQPNWQQHPTAPPGTPELVPGETRWDQRLLPRPPPPPLQSPDVLSHQVPALGAALVPGVSATHMPVLASPSSLSQTMPRPPGSGSAKLAISHLVRLIPNQH